MSVRYFVTESTDVRFYVQHTDENGVTWDADLDGFDTEAEAEAFREEIQEDQPDD
jgi:hypothetical protein